MPWVQSNVGDPTKDPFADLDKGILNGEEELGRLVQLLDSDMIASDYLNAHEDVPTCSTFEKTENWRQELRDMVVKQGCGSKKLAAVESDSDEE